MINSLKLNLGLILFIPLIGVVGCQNKEETISSNNFLITNFTLNQLDNIGKPHFNLTSTEATIDPITNDIEAKNVSSSSFHSRHNSPSVTPRQTAQSFCATTDSP